MPGALRGAGAAHSSAARELHPPPRCAAGLPVNLGRLRDDGVVAGHRVVPVTRSSGGRLLRAANDGTAAQAPGTRAELWDYLPRSSTTTPTDDDIQPRPAAITARSWVVSSSAVPSSSVSP